MNSKQVLLLNADYRPVSVFPLSVITWQQAIKLLFEEIVTVVSEYDEEIHSPSVTIKIPSVVALKHYVNTPTNVPFTRLNVFVRDKFCCQYCGGKFASSDLTFDHVIPRSAGGKTNWDNIVAACIPCNTRKDSKIMTPLQEPFRPTTWQLAANMREIPSQHLNEDWRSYLYWHEELDDNG